MPVAESATHERPKLTVAEQIEHLKSKGIKFEKYSEADAATYLQENNNYFKLRSYRKNFEKYQNGENEGLYIDLDFAMLRDLAILDMELRYEILPMVLDIEHFEKVKLLRYIAESEEDAYSIVSSYLNHLQEKEELDPSKKLHTSLINEITRNQENSYCSGIVQKYQNNFPIWAFLEVITFGSFIHFLKYCLEYFEDEQFRNLFQEDYYLLRSIKTIRNAAAHSNCILNQLARNTSKHQTKHAVSRAIGNMGISKTTRNHLMTSAAVQDIITLLYTHQEIVTSNGVKKHRANKLKALMNRFFYHIDFYQNNPVINTSFDFFKKAIDNFYGMWYNTDT